MKPIGKKQQELEWWAMVLRLRSLQLWRVEVDWVGFEEVKKLREAPARWRIGFLLKLGYGYRLTWPISA